MNPINKKWLLIIFLAFAVIAIVSGVICYEMGVGTAMNTPSYETIFFPAGTGFNERVDFMQEMQPIFPGAPVGLGALLLVIIMESVLIYRLIVTRAYVSTTAKLATGIFYQILVAAGFLGIVFIPLFSIMGYLTSQVPKRVEASADYRSMAAGKVITDPSSIRLMVASSTVRISIAQDPLLSAVSLKPQKTFFEAYVIPRYIAYHKDDPSSQFRQYASSSYYLIEPNYLIVNGNEQFIKDLGYAVMRNILAPAYPQYVMTKPPDQFSVVPESDYSARYRDAQVKRFQDQISGAQKVIDSNNAAVARNDQIIAEDKIDDADDPAQFAIYQQQAATIQQDAETQNQIGEADIAAYSAQIKDMSDPDSLDFKKSDVIVGAFIPPASILIKEPDPTENLSELVRVIVHESLHYYASVDASTSYATGLTEFLFEGFTEYLALHAIGYPDAAMVHISGYPVHVQVIALLLQKIPLAELEKINFSDDQDLFKADFKKYFPGSDYDAFIAQTNQMDTDWFTQPAKPNDDYVSDPSVLKIKALLKL